MASETGTIKTSPTHVHHGKEFDLRECDEQTPNSENAGSSSVAGLNEVFYRTGLTGHLFLVVIIISLGLTMFVYAMDEGVTQQFTLIAASSFSMHAQLGAVNTASTVINGITKPVIGKLADVLSRPTSYIISLLFYVIGYVVAASCTNFVAYTVGVALTAVGKAGLNILCQIIVGDLTTLQWRGFWTSMIIAPYLVTTFTNGFIIDAFVPEQWRWGLGMFAIMIPVLLIPAIIALYGTQQRARHIRRMGSGAPEKEKESTLHTAWQCLIAIDIPGLVLLGFSFSLILLPLSLAEAAENGWKNRSMIAMEAVGFVILALFVAFEMYIAPKPIMTKRIIANKVFLAALGANLFDQMTTTLGSNYFSSYIYIIKDWDNYTWTVFTGARNLAITVFSMAGGFLQVRYHGYRTQMIIGAVLKVVGYAACLTSDQRSTQSTAALAISQVLLGTSALTALGSRIGAMASVPHEDMASIIAAYFLWTYLGSAAGYAIASAIWTDRMLGFMRQELPDAPDSTLQEIYSSVSILHTEYDLHDPIREGAIRAYARTNGIIFIVAAAISTLSIFCSFMMPDYYLGKQQNAVTNLGLDGKPVELPTGGKREQSFWARMKSRYFKET
ncbi:major facilitator superfamily domain-containing protein [Aspergillus pseudonomiae]|uniref:Major facilitator superfamily domain-containing protein n=1 Tax=Aspergillus pseudonomiae TaxID=1506151 RepID=A0A5N7DUB7_9EURO|nr:major facilitator superfamily domain-containing protein [Aspergillus pseudonomiae]KAB8264271.1 major facilitator superfamily domain-containing protein [Aspergillus pseudonomiae]KAE8409118.1 major facilitator superfamily domain-containing protein [Aspergillus pseudonomiae]